MSKLQVDSVDEVTSANGVTIDGLNIKDSKLTTANSVVTTNITDANVTTAKITDANVTTAKIADVNVTEGKIADNAITLAKMASGTDGNIISYDASGNPVAIATGNDGQVLTSTGAGSQPAFETLPAGVTLSGTTNNTVATVTGANALVGEANLTFDGTTLSVDGGAIFNESGADVDFRVESDTGTNAFLVDGATGNVGIGLSGPTYRLQLTSVYETSESPKVFKAYNNSAGSTSTPQYTYWDMAGHGGADRVRFISYDYSQNSGTRSRFNIQTSVDGGSLADRFVIQNDGDVTINNQVSIGTTTTNARLFVESDAASISPFRINDTSSGSTSRNCAIFQRAGTNVGFIATTNNATSFVTSSDYRLKENVSYDFDATTRLKQLKPARFNFIKDADTTVDGFLAHEVSSVVPEAISGTKDKTETKEKVVVNSYGNVIAENIEQEDWEIDKTAADKKYPTDSTWEATKVVPVYQGIDQSKLVPLLVKTIQELEARITTLESK